MAGGCRRFCVSGWSLPCPDVEAEDAEGRRMALGLTTELWTCHPFSSSPRTAGGLFFTSCTGTAWRGWWPGKEQEAAPDLLLKAGEGPVEEFGQKCHTVNLAAPIHVVGRGDFSQISVEVCVVSPV